MSMKVVVVAGREEDAVAARTALDALLKPESVLALTCNGVNIPLSDLATSELWDTAYRIASEALSDCIDVVPT